MKLSLFKDILLPCLFGALFLLIGIWFGKVFLIESSIDKTEAETQIRETLARQDSAWNNGDIHGFMQDYWKSENLRFASGGGVNRGWQVTKERYLSRYPDKAAMGTLSFTDLEIEILGNKDALVFGRWSLNREDDRPNGLFTLHMRRNNGVWNIMSDHTSSAN